MYYSLLRRKVLLPAQCANKVGYYASIVSVQKQLHIIAYVVRRQFLVDSLRWEICLELLH